MPGKIISSLLVYCLCAIPLTGNGQENPLLLSGARLFIGDGTVVENGDVLIADGTIQGLGPAGSLIAPGAATQIDLGGKTVMPALIDGHAHIGFQARGGWGAEHYGANNIIDNLQQYAYYGFGTVFSAGSDSPGIAAEVERRRQAGDFVGARLLIAAGMGPPGQGPNNQFLGEVQQIEQARGETILWGLESPDQVREVVGGVAALGLEFIKIWVDDRGGSQQKLEPALYRPLIEQARGQGIKVFVHQQLASDMPDLLEAGAAGFLHGRLGPDLGPAIARQTRQADAFVVPNLGLGELRGEAIGDDSFLSAILTPGNAAALGAAGSNRRARPTTSARDSQLRQSLAYLLEAGADIVLGTDAGAVPDHPFGYTGHRELEIFVRLGMTPSQALVAATGVAARHLGLDDGGLLRPGYRADLLVLDADPQLDIRNTRRIDSVYLGGEAVDRDGLLRLWRGDD